MDSLYNLSFIQAMLTVALECAENDASGIALELVNEESGFRMKFRIEFDEFSIDDPEEMNEVNECIDRIYGARDND